MNHLLTLLLRHPDSLADGHQTNSELFVQLFVVAFVAAVVVVDVDTAAVEIVAVVVGTAVVEIAVAAVVEIVAVVEVPFVSFEPSDLVFLARPVFRPKMIKQLLFLYIF